MAPINVDLNGSQAYIAKQALPEVNAETSNGTNGYVSLFFHDFI